MELLQGQTLKEALKDGPLPLGQVLEFAIQITCGLEEAHETGIIHRDIKPANIFIVRKQQSSQQAKILDFGLAKQASSSSLLMRLSIPPGQRRIR
jgi:eukaryotic-like serine/threonine-protein kinase